MLYNTQHSKIRALIASGILGATFLSGCGGGGATMATQAESAALPPSTTAAAAPTTVPAGTNQNATDATVATATSCTPSGNWGNFDRPFAADSPWNSRPVNPVFGTAVIPTALYTPQIQTGIYSTAAFKATAADGPMTVYANNSKGIWDPDAEVYTPTVTLPRWPSGVTPATGGDGHAEIVDTVTGVVHSLYQLKQVNGIWQATQHSWMALNGRGFGDPARYFQGSRSAGISTIGGLIRKNEVGNGDTMYRHALAMSLDFTGMAKDYVFPATATDWNAATANTGLFPNGSLMMLPANFDAQRVQTPELRKIAETLKNYGAYVVDRNSGTPFVIYMEIGSAYNGGWTATGAADLELIRQALRKVESAEGWIDGDGRTFSKFNTNLNLLSMRGYWYRLKGTQTGVFDSERQAVVFPATTSEIQQINSGGRAYAGVTWAKPTVGASYSLLAKTTGGGKFRMVIRDKATNTQLYDSGILADGQSANFAWPAENFVIWTYAISGIDNQVSTVSAQLMKNGAPSDSQCSL